MDTIYLNIKNIKTWRDESLKKALRIEISYINNIAGLFTNPSINEKLLDSFKNMMIIRDEIIKRGLSL